MDIIIQRHVSLINAHPLILTAWNTALLIAQDMGADKIIMTSGFRQRKRGEDFSFHHVDRGIDFKVIFNNPRNIILFEKKYRAGLSKEFQILYHKDRGTKDNQGRKHFHTEIDYQV